MPDRPARALPAAASAVGRALALVAALLAPLAAVAPGRAARAQPSLREALHEAVRVASRVPYSHATLVDAWDVLSEADADPARPGHVRTIYGDASFPAASTVNEGWEREHLWPRSRGTGDTSACGFPHNDLHHLFPSEPDLNQSRGNLPFDDCTAPDCAVKGAGNRMRGGDDGAWEVWPGRRGDVARAIFYMDVRYEGGINLATGCSEPDLVVTDTRAALVPVPEMAPTGAMGILAALLRWHAEDPVDDGERRRNDVVQRFQGNRNPFVDDPSLVCRLWACPMPPTASPTPSEPATAAPPSATATPAARTPTATPTATVDAGGDPATPGPPMRWRAHLPVAASASDLPNAVATAVPSATPSPPPTRTAAPTPTPSETPTPPAGAALVIAALRCDTRDETIRVRNDGTAPAPLSGWSIVSVVGSQTFAFPGYTLAPGASVSVHSGPDAPPTGGDVLRWTTGYIWNNDGDTAELVAPDGTVMDERDC